MFYLSHKCFSWVGIEPATYTRSLEGRASANLTVRPVTLYKLYICMSIKFQAYPDYMDLRTLSLWDSKRSIELVLH